MDRTGQLSSNAAMFRLDVYPSLNNGVWGKLWNIYRPDPIVCENIGHMLLRLDQFCDELNYPMACERRRSYAGARAGAEIGKSELCHDVNAFNPHEKHRIDRFRHLFLQDDRHCIRFFIHVLFRQNASMQGTVLQTAARGKQTFRSGLELMSLIQEVLAEPAAIPRVGG